MSSEGEELLQLPPWIFFTERLISLYLLPVYRYGSLLSIDTKMSNIELDMTSRDVIRSAHPHKFECIENIHEN